jgi:peptide-methionine (S)-S-oxide reductase
VSRQYASIVFTHDEEQRKLAEETKAREAEERGRAIHTEIADYTEFWRAEDYHQKYRLRGVKDLFAEFEAMYPNTDDLVDSTAAARVNGYVGGHGTMEQLEDEIGKLGLSEERQKRLREIAERRLR